MPSADKNPTIPQQVLDLVDRFDRNRYAYKSGNYNETQARREFLDPLFKALGWDIDNEQGYAEAYKDVIHEDAGIHHGGAVAASRITCSHSPRCSTALRLVWKLPIKLSACQKNQKANPTRRKSFIAGNCAAADRHFLIACTVKCRNQRFPISNCYTTEQRLPLTVHLAFGQC